MREPPLRPLILVSAACVLASIAVSFLLPESPQYVQLREAAYALSPSWLSDLPGGEWLALGVLSVIIVAHAIGYVGLFLYRRWGRVLAVATTAAIYLPAPLLGPVVSTGIEDLLGGVSTLTWGAALALAYWSSAARRFESVDTSPNANITVLAPP